MPLFSSPLSRFGALLPLLSLLISPLQAAPPDLTAGGSTTFGLMNGDKLFYRVKAER